MDESSSGILHFAFIFRILYKSEQAMKHAKIISLTSVLVLALTIVTPLLTTNADAAAVLQLPTAAAANIGESFEIMARGRAGCQPSEGEEFQFTYLTRMTVGFVIEKRGDRGVVLSICVGTFSLNDTLFTVDEGVGFAARPQVGELNVTVVFGFRLNMTGPDGGSASLIFVGGVKRTQRLDPVLIIKGILDMDGTVFMFAQLGKIHRV